MELTVANVNHSFHKLVPLVCQEAASNSILIGEQQSRNGKVLVFNQPVTITYTKPTERVLFNRYRNPNPFFHLYEALWMLAGRNDVAPLKFYNSKISQYSDDGKMFNGAYGYRWRHANVKPNHWGHSKSPGPEFDDGDDQLNLIVAHLKALPDSRRAVLQMWNVEDDLLNAGGMGMRAQCRLCYGSGGWFDEDKRMTFNCDRCKGTGWTDKCSNDLCCNLNVMFSIRKTRDREEHEDSYSNPDEWLDMTVVNRSNDMIWGMLGANYVHFSMLQEYMAARIGVGVGKYSHFTNNLHVYEWNWKPEEWMKEYLLPDSHNLMWYDECTFRVPLVGNAEKFDEELPKVVEHFSKPAEQDATDKFIRSLTERFFKKTAAPAFAAWAAYKSRTANELAANWCSRIEAPDWRKACSDWVLDAVTARESRASRATNNKVSK